MNEDARRHGSAVLVLQVKISVATSGRCLSSAGPQRLPSHNRIQHLLLHIMHFTRHVGTLSQAHRMQRCSHQRCEVAAGEVQIGCAPRVCHTCIA